MTSTPKLDIPRSLTRSAVVDPDWERRSAAWHVQFLCEQFGVPDLGGLDMLDVGCGVKLARHFVNEQAPVGRYVGVDVHARLIDFLRRNVTDPRLEFHHLDARNALYNPEGAPFTDATRLPLGDRRFDAICLFSVFTHLAPEDYRTMLRLLRPHIRPGGRLLYSLFIDRPTPGGFGITNTLLGGGQGREEGAVPPYRDLDPARPLLYAVYSEAHARELIEGTGWRAVRLNDPGPYVQHSFLCEPV